MLIDHEEIINLINKEIAGFKRVEPIMAQSKDYIGAIRCQEMQSEWRYLASKIRELATSKTQANNVDGFTPLVTKGEKISVTA